jgi:hypothetical protein
MNACVIEQSVYNNVLYYDFHNPHGHMKNTSLMDIDIETRKNGSIQEGILHPSPYLVLKKLRVAE